MTTFSMIMKNLGRNRRRTALTVAAIAMPIFAFTFARTFVDLTQQFFEESDRKMRVAVHHKLTYTAALPERMRDEIEALAPPGYLNGVLRTAWFGGRVQDSKLPFPSFSADRDTFARVMSEFEMTPAEIEAFQRERRGAVIGKALADGMNWKVGDRITLRGGIPPFVEMEFIIVAIPRGLENAVVYFGHDYCNEVWLEETGRARGVNNFWLKCNSEEARTWALTAIDRHFANTEYETESEMESQFIASFTQSGGDWVGLVWTVGRMVVVVAVMVALNTMSMAFRERTQELAVMRAVGFSATRITFLVLIEGLILGVIGGLVAVLPPYLITNLVTVRVPGMGAAIEVPATSAAMAFAVALGAGGLAALAPAWMAGRLQVAAALRKVV